jgi:hypothetical protein
MQNPGSDAGVFVWAIASKRNCLPIVIPGRAKREPGIHNHRPALLRRKSAASFQDSNRLGVWIPGSMLRIAPE